MDEPINPLGSSEDFPTVGISVFDLWMRELYIILVCNKIIDVMDYFTLDREHYKQYYNVGCTPTEAFEEEMSYYG